MNTRESVGKSAQKTFPRTSETSAEVATAAERTGEQEYQGEPAGKVANRVTVDESALIYSREDASGVSEDEPADEAVRVREICWASTDRSRSTRRYPGHGQSQGTEEKTHEGMDRNRRRAERN